MVHIFGEVDDDDAEALSPVYCLDPGAPEAPVIYHRNLLQCSGESNWVCLDCGEHTGAAEA